MVGVQVLAAQWTLDAVLAYNELVEYLPKLPQETKDDGASDARPVYCYPHQPLTMYLTVA